jgi:hypothetical protein
MNERFDVFLRCSCGHEGQAATAEHPGRTGERFRCDACGNRSPETVVWPIWQRAYQREGWSPWD